MVVNEADGHNAQFDGHQDQCMPEAQLLNSHWVLLHRRECCSLLLGQGILVLVPLKKFNLSLKSTTKTNNNKNIDFKSGR